MTKSADSYKQARTERGEGLDRRNSSGRSSERKKNPLLPKKRIRKKSNESYH